jgi:hypothetical protein
MDRNQHGGPGADARDSEEGLARGDVDHFDALTLSASLFCGRFLPLCLFSFYAHRDR